MKTLLALVSLALILGVHLTNCAPSQQQSSEQTNSLGQDSFDAYSSSDGASGLVFGLLGRPTSGNNNKRARKMSAFVPMRGRKDGRDDRRKLAAINQLLGALEQPMRELDGQEASIARLVGSSLSSSSSSATGGPSWSGARPTWQLAPSQFASQFAIQHLLAGHPERPLAAEPSGQLMEAKLRRAFHPMRGKKSEANDQQADSLVNELLMSAESGDGDAGDDDSQTS